MKLATLLMMGMVVCNAQEEPETIIVTESAEGYDCAGCWSDWLEFTADTEELKTYFIGLKATVEAATNATYGSWTPLKYTQ